MTNRSDLDKYCAQIELVKQLLGPETFDLNKVLIELETKKKLLMTFKPRDYATILKGLESGALIHPGDWVLEEKKEIIPVKKEEKTPEEPKIDKEKIALKKELQLAKDKLVELEKEEETEIREEVIEEIGE